MGVDGPADGMNARRAVVLVQGELAQSPRMLNHARLLLARGWRVVLVGYAGVPLPRDLATHPRLAVEAIATRATQRWAHVPQAFYLVAALVRSAAVGAGLTLTLLRAGAAELYLVQNPPALPAVPLVRALAAIRRARMVVDWHNTSASVLAFRLGRTHPLVAAVRRLEQFCAHGASGHLCVSAALRSELGAHWNVAAAVVRDRPRRRLEPVARAERRTIVRRLLGSLGAGPLDESTDPAIVISPSSWSLEEDVSMLLDGLALYAGIAGARAAIVFATGLGPGRAAFEARAAQLAARHVRIVTGWLDDDAYGELLTAADVGVCMHRSTSALDLPMKLIDFEAAGVPALAFDYGVVLRELPRLHGTFRTAGQLAEMLHACLAGTTAPPLSCGADETTWDEEWSAGALPMLCP